MHEPRVAAVQLRRRGRVLEVEALARGEHPVLTALALAINPLVVVEGRLLLRPGLGANRDVTNDVREGHDGDAAGIDVDDDDATGIDVDDDDVDDDAAGADDHDDDAAGVDVDDTAGVNPDDAAGVNASPSGSPSKTGDVDSDPVPS